MADIDLAGLDVEKIVDARGSASPLVDVKNAIGNIGFGLVLEIWSDDPEAKKDIQSWAKDVRQKYLGSAQGQGYDRIFVLRRK